MTETQPLYQDTCATCRNSGPLLEATEKSPAEVRCLIWTQVQQQWDQAIGESWRPASGWCPYHAPAAAKKQKGAG